MAISREDALRELARRELARRKQNPQYRVTDDMSTGERLLAGIGGGMVEGARKGVNFVLPDSLTPEWASDEAIKEQARIDQDLDSTGAGMAGKIIGQTALSAPVGGAVGSGAKLALAASRGVRGAELLGAARGYGVGRAALEGAVEGAMLSNPGERLKGAAFGAGAGTIGAGASKGIGYLAGKLTPTESAASIATRKAMEDAGVSADDAFIPISQGAEDGLWKQFYEGIVSNLPGGSGKLRKQFSGALQSFRQTSLREASPVFPVGGELRTPGMGSILQHGDDIHSGLNAVDGHWDDAFEAARDVAGIRIPKNWKSLPGVLRDFLDKKGYKIPSGNVTGRELIDLKEASNVLVSHLKGQRILTKSDRDALQLFNKELDARIIGSLKRVARLRNSSPEMKLAADAYIQNLKRYPRWLQVKSAATKAGGTSEFSPQQLLNAATKQSPRGMFGGGGRMQELGKIGRESLKEFPSRPGVYQLAAAAGLLGGGTLGYGDQLPGGTVGGALTGLGMLYGGSRGLASRAVQRRLMGQFSRPEQLMAAGLRRAGRLGRAATIPAYLENQDEP